MLTLQDLRDRNLILLESIAGSKAYGTSTPQSDTDIRGVFYLPKHEFFGMEYIQQVNDPGNDVIFYEIRRFFELLSKNNPNILELLNMPEDCILHKDPVMDLIKPEDVLSKLCKQTFGGYAKAQIQKAYGLNKKILNPIDKERKLILDFCYVAEGQGSVPVNKWLSDRNWEQLDCALVSIPHMKNVFGLYYEGPAYARQNGFKGIMLKEDANMVRLTSIPHDLQPKGIMAFNLEGYQKYCKDYKAYWDWVAERNEARYENTVQSGKNYDAKNMMHTFRLLDMAREIAELQQIIVRRPNREKLLEIRRGVFQYADLVEQAETQLNAIDALFEASPLPDEPDLDLLNDKLRQIRTACFNKPS